METHYYSARDLAAQFRITAQTLRNWERDKKIPATGRTPGGHRRYTEEHVKAIQAMLGTVSDQTTAATV
jgi:DNA-binding transcriptional MerR regulator